MTRGVCCAFLLAAAATGSAPLHAAAPDFEQIRRDLRIGADVMRSSLLEVMPESRQVVELEAGYLEGQGVLVIVELAGPWLRLDGRRIELREELTSLEQIPEMLQEILTEVDLGLPREQVATLEELREIRDIGRAVRAEQRALRAEIRAKRRELQRTGDSDAAETLAAEIEALRQNLAAAQAEEHALEDDAALARRDLDTLGPDGEPGAESGDLDRAVAEAVCGYGATFKFLGEDQYLNVLVRQAGRSRYYAFTMSRVRACKTGKIGAQTLLEGSFAYRS